MKSPQQRHPTKMWIVTLCAIVTSAVLLVAAHKALANKPPCDYGSGTCGGCSGGCDGCNECCSNGGNASKGQQDSCRASQCNAKGGPCS